MRGRYRTSTGSIRDSLDSCLELRNLNKGFGIFCNGVHVYEKPWTAIAILALNLETKPASRAEPRKLGENRAKPWWYCELLDEIVSGAYPSFRFFIMWANIFPFKVNLDFLICFRIHFLFLSYWLQSVINKLLRDLFSSQLLQWKGSHSLWPFIFLFEGPMAYEELCLKSQFQN